MTAFVETIAAPTPASEVAAVVGRLSELRSAAQRRRYSGATPQLPSRQSVLAMADDVFGALYPRHLGGRDIPNRDLDRYVAQALEKALSVLEQEIALELSLDRSAGVWATKSSNDAARIAAEIMATLPGLRQQVDLDIRASLAADPSQGVFDELVFCSASVAAILSHRFAHALYRLGVPLMAKIIAGDCRSRTGVDIHPGAQIGDAFSFAHSTGLTIGETAVIGRNVRMHAPVVLGESFSIMGGEAEPSSDKLAAPPAGENEAARRHPRIEDDVVILAGACLYGPIVVGRGSVIGRNVWLLRDIPPNSRIESTKATA